MADGLDSLLDDTLDEFTAGPSPSPDVGAPAASGGDGQGGSGGGGAGAGLASVRLAECAARLQARFGAHPDIDLIRAIATNDVAALEASSRPSAAASAASSKQRSAAGKAPAKEPSIFQKGFLNKPSGGKDKKATSPPPKGATKGTAGAAAGQGGVGSVDSAIADALKGLQENRENVAGSGAFPGMPPGGFPGMPQSEEEMAKLIQQMLEDPEGSNGVMDSMLTSLFAKDILYPSLGEVQQQYPAWLAENKGKHPASEIANYEGQHRLVCEMIAVYEDTKLDSAGQAKKVMKLMESMSELGSPPKELIEKLGLQLGPDGAVLPPGGVPGQCSVM